MRYMLLLYVTERAAPGTPEGAQFYGAMREFHEECERRGVLVAAEPLREPATATTVRVREGTVLRTGGPFAETTEWLGGYFLLDCDEQEALDLAARCPSAHGGAVEVRPIMPVAAPAPQSS